MGIELLLNNPISFSNKYNQSRKCYSNIFHDNCQVYRKNTTDLCNAILPASEFVLHSGREKITKPYFALLERFQETKEEGNEWMRNYTDKIRDNGNYLQLVQNIEVNAIGKDAFVDMNEIISPEIRVREFIGRQLSGIGVKPEKVQATFMMGSAMMLAQNIVDVAEWREIGPDICAELGWSFRNTLCFRYMLAEAARRMGKTRSISMTSVNYALSLPGSTIIVFSTSQDASDLLRTDVDTMLDEAGEVEFAGKMYKLTDLKVSKGKRRLTLRSPYDPTKLSTIYFKPGLHKHNMDKQVCFFNIYFFLKKRIEKKGMLEHDFLSVSIVVFESFTCETATSFQFNFGYGR